MWGRLAIAGAVAGFGFGVGGFVAVRAASTANHAAEPCAARVTLDVIPRWARSGFSGSVRMPYALGREKEIVGLLFAYPLKSPPPPGQGNKILWVARRPEKSRANLRIQAVRMVGSRPVGAAVRRVVAGGVGPSIINLPRPGCWRFTLSWAQGQDTLDLRYLAS
jgi:hypothetical protein